MTRATNELEKFLLALLLFGIGYVAMVEINTQGSRPVLLMLLPWVAFSLWFRSQMAALRAEIRRINSEPARKVQTEQAE